MVRSKKAVLSFAALIVAVWAAPVAAKDSVPSTGVFKTGQQIYDLCVSKDAASLDRCDNFLMAAHDMIKLFGDTKMAEDNICLAQGTTAGEIRGAILAYWRADMGALKFTAVSAIRNALIDKYGS